MLNGDDRETGVTSGMRKGLTSYGDKDFSLFLRKAFIKAMGYSDDALDRPIVGITNTYSDFNPCHGNVPQLIEAVKRGAMLAGAMPMVFPTISIHESFAYPTSMFLRNLMAMDTEEMIRALPVDSVVLIGGCDKTTPAQVMAAVSADRPTIVLPVGPMLVGHFKGEVLGACTDCRQALGRVSRRPHQRRGYRSRERAAGAVDRHLRRDGHGEHHRLHDGSDGHDAAGRGDDRRRSHADRVRIAEATGKRAAEMTKGGPKPSDIITKDALQQRHRHAAGDRRLDQRRGASLRHRRPHATRRCRWRNIDEIGKQDAGAGRSEAVRRSLHGAFPLCRRRAAADAGTEGSARSSTRSMSWAARSATRSRCSRTCRARP